MTLPIALLGCGRWGRRVLAALTHHPLIRVCAVIDPQPQARAAARLIAPHAMVLEQLHEALSLGVRAGYVATPPELHFRHASELLASGCDVLLEKPVCIRVEQARQLNKLARHSDRLVMAGHLLRYHAAYEALLQRAAEGVIGKPRKVFARRLSASGASDVLWRLAPHDLATLYALDGSRILSCQASLQGAMTVMRLQLASGLRARLELSTSGTSKQRTFSVIGDAGELLVDELDTTTPLRFIHAAAAGPPSAPPRAASYSVRDEGDPLSRQLDHFVACVASRRQPRTDLREAEWTVSAIQQARAAFRAAGIAEAV